MRSCDFVARTHHFFVHTPFKNESPKPSSSPSTKNEDKKLDPKITHIKKKNVLSR